MTPDLRIISVTAFQKVVRATKRRDLVWQISVDLVAKEISASLGNDEEIVVPFSVFKKSPSGLCQVAVGAKPNFEKPDIRDHGQTIGLGEYEAPVESILIEHDFLRFPADFEKRWGFVMDASERSGEYGKRAVKRLRARLSKQST